MSYITRTHYRTRTDYVVVCYWRGQRWEDLCRDEASAHALARAYRENPDYSDVRVVER